MVVRTASSRIVAAAHPDIGFSLLSFWFASSPPFQALLRMRSSSTFLSPRSHRRQSRPRLDTAYNQGTLTPEKRNNPQHLNPIPAEAKHTSMICLERLTTDDRENQWIDYVYPQGKGNASRTLRNRNRPRFAHGKTTVMSPPGPPASLARASLQKERDGCRESRRAGKPSRFTAIHLSRVQRQGFTGRDQSFSGTWMPYFSMR